MAFDIHRRRVLLLGATHFLGSRLVGPLEARGWVVRCASRAPLPAAALATREWTTLDAFDEDSLAPALRGCDAAIYVVKTHGIGAGCAERDREAAFRFASAAARAGVHRIVSIGGVAPVGHASRLMRVRTETGRALRASGVSTIELRAGLIIGAGGESWNAVRDLAVRLPLLPDAPWLRSQIEPVAVDDVTNAVVHALDLGDEASAVYGLPGPERMSARSLLERVAALAGRRLLFVPSPLLPPTLAARALPLLTRADNCVARELVEGLRSDLVSQSPPFWSLLGDVPLLPFDVAARRALDENEMMLPLTTRAFETLVGRFTPWARGSAS